MTRTGPATTKFVRPPLPSTLVERPELVRRLDEAATRPVTLVAGSPGFGKTVLLAEWLSDRPERSAAWLTCDSWDQDEVRLWTSIASALSCLRPEIGADALDLLLEGFGSIDDVVASLVNELSQSPEPAYLVIDDLHLVPLAALEGLATFCERLPTSVRIVIGSRADPLLPLHRWRARGTLSEVREADLRLHESDVAAMTAKFDLRLSPEEIGALTRRTEGWAAGVQLAAISLQGTTDQGSFISSFAGSDRIIVEFLIGEVLARQSIRMAHFLKSTSVVEDFDVELAGVLAECDDASALLREAEAAGLFLVPLGGEPRRYRYHQLFRDLLRAELASEDPTGSRALHLRAADWYEHQGSFTQAVEEFVRAGEVGRAFALLHDHVIQSWMGVTRLDIGSWLERLPEEALAHEAERMLDYSLMLGLLGRVDEQGVWLRRSAEVGDPGPHSPFRIRWGVVDALWHGLRGELEQAVAFANGPYKSLERGADPVVDEFPPILARVQLYLEDPDAAIMTCNEELSYRPSAVSEATLYGVRALALFEKGELVDAEASAHESMALAGQGGFLGHVGMFDTVLTLGALALEHGQLDQAERLIEDALVRSERVRPPFELLALVERAAAHRVRSEVAEAFTTLERARHVLPPNVESPLWRRVDLLEAEIRIDVGDLDQAWVLVEKLPSSPRRSLVEAAVFVASGELQRAQQSIAPLADSTLSIRLELERLMLNVQIGRAVGQDVEVVLDQAIALARQQNFGLTLVQGHAEIAGFVIDRLRRSPSDVFTDRAIAAADRILVGIAAAKTGPELLSEREQGVLRYLPTRLTSREIATELYVSMNTLKTHLKSIYRKLDASSRGDAVVRARSLGLL